ncbi:MAG TPA: prepilin-type N-terminal cleavage/methylation domain-containing protein [Pyrinomonadaceae bacterium]|jgi:type II secretory pathway pseudopilin PulG|nr:prepilin-type N-terminal cleavage/methylation domain-containing protein [Pyrinomonadaceae bacterium]
MQNRRFQSDPKTHRSPAGGFSIVELLVAVLILTIALLGVASAISYALMAGNRGRGVTNAKMLVVSILEQMETLRDTRALTFDEISNGQVSGSSFTGFPYSATDFRPVSTTPGPDGVFGTADDLIDPGPDGVYGNSNDFTNPLLARPGVTRQILITTFPTNPFIKKIKVTLRYQTAGGKQTDLVGISYLNDDSHGTYIP